MSDCSCGTVPSLGMKEFEPIAGTTYTFGYGITKNPSDCSFLIAGRTRTQVQDQHSIMKICSNNLQFDSQFGGNGGYNKIDEPEFSSTASFIEVHPNTGKREITKSCGFLKIKA